MERGEGVAWSFSDFLHSFAWCRYVNYVPESVTSSLVKEFEGVGDRITIV